MQNVVKGLLPLKPVITAEQFWPHVVIKAADECWEWQGVRRRDGYGHATRRLYAHRAAWELTNGPIPRGLHVCHHCDNPPCCNPSHLFLGTDKTNHYDAAMKGRRAQKLTPAIVRTIRNLVASGTRQRAVARVFSISQPMVGYIARRDMWVWVAFIAFILCTAASDAVSQVGFSVLLRCPSPVCANTPHTCLIRARNRDGNSWFVTEMRAAVDSIPGANLLAAPVPLLTFDAAHEEPITITLDIGIHEVVGTLRATEMPSQTVFTGRAARILDVEDCGP